jgi:hypothetical protein
VSLGSTQLVNYRAKSEKAVRSGIPEIPFGGMKYPRLKSRTILAVAGEYRGQGDRRIVGRAHSRGADSCRVRAQFLAGCGASGGEVGGAALQGFAGGGASALPPYFK